MTVFLLRHASPNWHRKDIPYDILPGPELLAKGKSEAAALAEFLKPHALARLYYSPFERSAQTAKIIAAANQIPAVEESQLKEWRGADESESQVRARMRSIFELAAAESRLAGPIGLVSHGGPISVLLEELGMSREQLAPYRRMFDTTNPLPPAGAWKAEQVDGGWDLQLVFRPAGNEAELTER